MSPPQWQLAAMPALGDSRPPSGSSPSWRAEEQVDEDHLEDQVDGPEPPTENQWSEGSEGHPNTCDPCFWFWRGCKTGMDCPYCHLCPPGEKKRRAKAKKAEKKAELKTQQRGDIEEFELAAQNSSAETQAVQCEPEADCLELPTEPQWSVGSEGHPSTCDPCAWFWRGCKNGADCTHCHLCPEGEKKKRTKERKAENKAMKRLVAAEVAEPAVQKRAATEAAELAVQKRVAADVDCAEAQSRQETTVEPPTEPMWSPGSEGHPVTCAPCAFFWKGCKNGIDCNHCHMCPEGEAKKRAKARKGELKAQNRAAASLEGAAELAASLLSAPAKPSMAPHVAAEQAAAASSWTPHSPQYYGSWAQWGVCPPVPMQQRWSDGQPATKRWREW